MVKSIRSGRIWAGVIIKSLKSHNMKKPLQIIFLLLIVFGCKESKPKADIETWKSEIIQAEKDFNDMAQDKGLEEAFHYFAAEDGVIKRGRKVVNGKKAIREWYQNDVRPNETLTWKPSYVDVSSSGDMAYTYGDFIFTSIDSTGTKKQNTGIFHTVWKRQEDGTWKFVWD